MNDSYLPVTTDALHENASTGYSASVHQCIGIALLFERTAS